MDESNLWPCKVLIARYRPRCHRKMVVEWPVQRSSKECTHGLPCFFAIETRISLVNESQARVVFPGSESGHMFMACAEEVPPTSETHIVHSYGETSLACFPSPQTLVERQPMLRDG